MNYYYYNYKLFSHKIKLKGGGVFEAILQTMTRPTQPCFVKKNLQKNFPLNDLICLQRTSALGECYPCYVK